MNFLLLMFVFFKCHNSNLPPLSGLWTGKSDPKETLAEFFALWVGPTTEPAASWEEWERNMFSCQSLQKSQLGVKLSPLDLTSLSCGFNSVDCSYFFKLINAIGRTRAPSKNPYRNPENIFPPLRWPTQTPLGHPSIICSFSSWTTEWIFSTISFEDFV